MVPQYFLPLITADNRILATIAIPLTTFEGTETHIKVGTTVYPLVRKTYTVVPSWSRTMDYMATTIDRTTELTQNWVDKSRLLTPLLGQPKWYAGRVQQLNEFSGADLTYFMTGAVKTAAFTFVPPTVPGGSNVSQTWYANSPFSNTPDCQFVDVNWQALAGVTNPQNLQTVTLGSPSADPGSGTALKAVVVTPVNVVNAGAAFTTIRVVRITRGAIPSGTYTWPLTLLDIYGQTSTLNISVVVA